MEQTPVNSSSTDNTFPDFQKYRLNVDTIESLDDVKVILHELYLTTNNRKKAWPVLKKYFTTLENSDLIPLTF
jgi:hypothetical protein